MAFEIPVLPEGMAVQVDGNGAGRIKYFESALGKTSRYRVLLDTGNEAEIVWYKVTPILPAKEQDWPHNWADMADAHETAANKYIADRMGVKRPGPEITVETEVIKEEDGRLGYKYSSGKMRTTVGPAPDLMGAAQRHTGVVRASSGEFEVGMEVCLCRHPLWDREGHVRSKISANHGSGIEPWAVFPSDPKFQDAGFVWCNDSQITKLDANGLCPYQGGQQPNANMETNVDQGSMYYWGFRIGDDVAVRGWGAGKIHNVHTDQPKNKKPIAVELANGQRINAALQDLTKIQYGSVFPPLVQKVDSLSEQVRKLHTKLDKLIETLEGDGK